MRYGLLEPLRGMAALWVLLYHYTFGDAFRTAWPTLHAWCKLGHLGVPMFFGISGYCVGAAGSAAARAPGSTGKFLRRRLWRIYPAFWCSLPVVAALPFVLAALAAAKSGAYVAPHAGERGNGFLKYGPAEWLGIATLGQAFAPVDPDRPEPPKIEGGWLSAKFSALNAVYWTLAIEVQFYLVVAALAAAGPRWYWPGVAALAVAGLAARASPGFERTGLFLPYWPMFAFGAAVAWRRERHAAPGRPLLGWSAWGAFLLASVALAAWRLPAWHLPAAAAFALTLWLGQRADPSYAALSAGRSGWPLRALTFLGTMSYSLYLLHGRLYPIGQQWAGKAFAKESLPLDALALALTVALCVPFHCLCERPFLAKPKPPA